MKNYPAIWYTVLFIIGIIIYRLTGVNVKNFIFYFSILLIALLFAVIHFKVKSKSPTYRLAISLFVIIAGVFVSAFQKPDYKYLPEQIYIQKDFKAYGTISAIELIKKTEINFNLKTDTVLFAGLKYKEPLSLICRVRDSSHNNLIHLYNKILPGNKIEITGIFIKGRERRNPGEFDYNKYLHERGISGFIVSNSVDEIKILNRNSFLFGSIVFEIRKAIDNEITKLHSEKTAAFIRGQILADRSNIEYNAVVEFINSGVAHILAVSGLNVGFIVLIILILFGRFNIYLRSSLMIAGIIAFMILTNSQPSVIRATIMSGIIVIGLLTNRSTNIFNSLAVSALIILVIEPRQLFDPGFQLSYSAVFSIASIYPLYKKMIEASGLKSKMISYLLAYSGISLCAQIGTMPVTLIYFGKLSLVSLFTNLLVIPISGVVVGIGIFTLIINIISPVLAFYYATANNLLTSLMYYIIHVAGRFEYAFLWIRNFTLLDCIIFYFFLTIVLLSLKYFKSKAARLSITVLAALNIMVYCSLDDKHLLKDNRLNLMMIDVGQGDACLVRFPGGETALIDAGETSINFDNGERIVMPLLNYLNVGKIDYGFISHVDLDHYGGFVSLINENLIGKIFKPKLDSSFSKDLRFEKFVRSKKLPFQYYAKEIIKLKEGRIYILNFLNNDLKTTSNNRSGVLKIVYGNTSILFTGDLEKKYEKKYLSYYKRFLTSDILKVSHHGSKTGSSSEFISAVKPKYSLISAGIQNKFGHPAPESLYKLKSNGSKIFRTDKLGGVLFSSDGDSIFAVDWKND